MHLINGFHSLVAAAFLLAHLPALAADPAVITKIDQRPWILNAGGVLKSETELTIENHRGRAVDAWVKIRVPGKPDCMEALGSLPPGANKRVVHVPELTTDGDPVTFAIHDNQAGNTAPIGAKTLPQQKIRHWRLYVGHNSHMDIGYTEFQEDLKTKTWPGFWDQALLEDMPRSDSWPDDAKVRLEVEAVYQIDTSLPVRSADWFETLRERLAQGRFAYGAAFGNNAHSNWSAEELARSCYPAERHFKDKTGVESSKNIIMRDEPVLSWGVIDALVEAGAKSFTLQHNADHNPWRGTTTYPEFFYAQGRNPANRLLVWNAPVGNYSIDELGFRDKDLTKLPAAITAKLMGYQKDGTSNHRYPYDVAMVNFTYDGDNRPMDTQVYDNIKALNAKGYVYPRIINANYKEFFEDVAANWRDRIPSFKGTIEDWWNFGAASTAYETAINRMNHDKLAAAETLATVAGIAIPERRYPSEALAGAYENKGCLVSWKDQADAVFFEVFRGTSADFKPGTGTYLSTVSARHYYDPTVKDGLTRTYFYAVRAAGAGKKSGFPVPVKAVPGLAADTTAPSLPVLAGEALHATKVTLSWEPSTDNHAVAGYQVFRDGTRIADLSAVFNSWMDDAVKPGTTYRYTVKARDIAGNLSPDSNPAAVTTLR
jgi:hypothetical protein